MPGPDDILQRMLQQNPVVRNNPNNAPILNALERRDAQSGQQLAQNYINTMLNGINSGICSLGYDVASQINGVNTNIMQNGYNTANAITQAQFAQQQSAAALNLSASQSNQNAYLVAQLKTPAPVPAYTVPNPNGYYGGQQNCYQSCGC